MEVETLKEIDEHIDNQERNAQEVYENFDNMMAQNTANNECKDLHEGWKMQYSMDNNFSQSQKNLPEGLKVKEIAGCSTRMEEEPRRMETSGEHSKGLEENKMTLNERWKNV